MLEVFYAIHSYALVMSVYPKDALTETISSPYSKDS